MKVYDLIREILNSRIPKQLGYLHVIKSEWLPICKWRQNTMIENPYLEEYVKTIKTKGITVKKKALRLRTRDKILFSSWKFEFIPLEYKLVNGWLYAKLPKKYLCLSFKTKTQKLISALFINRVLCSRDVMALGLLKGEMINSLKGKSKYYLSFTNSDPTLVKIVLEFLKRIGANLNEIYVQILINNKENLKIDETKIKRYWASRLDIPSNKFVKSYVDTRFKTKNKYGAVSIKYYSTAFRLAIQTIVNYSKKLSRFYCINFLKGLLAAEGSINLSYNNSLNFVCIGGSKKDDVLLYQKILSVIGIKHGAVMKAVSDEEAQKRGWKKGTGGFMMIHGFNNYYKIYNYNLLALSDYKKIKFLYGLSHHKKVKNNVIQKSIQKKLKRLKTDCKDYYKNLKKIKGLTKQERRVLKLIKNRITTKELAYILKIQNSSAFRVLEKIKRKGKLKKMGNSIWAIL